MAGYNRQAADAAREAASSQGAQYDDSWKHRLRLVDGETLMVRFIRTNLPGQDPYNFSKHGTATRNSVQCTRPANCPLCNAVALLQANRSNSDVVKSPSARTAWQVLSCRVMFKDVPTDKGKKRDVPMHVNSNNQPLHVRRGGQGQPDVITPYPGGRHELDGVYAWAYEGLKFLEVSNTKKVPQTQFLFDLDAELEQTCQCGNLTSGPIRTPAKVAVVAHACAKCGTQYPVGDPAHAIVCQACKHAGTPVEVLACEANCGNPRRGGLNESYVLISQTGQGKDTTITFKALPPGPLMPEHQALLLNEDGSRKTLDIADILGPSEAMAVGTIRALAPQLRAAGVDPEQCINPAGGGSHQGAAGGAPPAGGFGGLPPFGSPTGSANPPRIAAAPASPFPTSSVPSAPTGSGVPQGTSQTGGAAPIPTAVPTVARPGMRLGG
jgi:hypothetical protein